MLNRYSATFPLHFECCDTSIRDIGFSVENFKLSNFLVFQSLSNDSTDDDSAEDVYGIVTCYSLTRPQDDVTKSLFDYLLSKCKGSKMADENRQYFEKVHTTSHSRCCLSGRWCHHDVCLGAWSWRGRCQWHLPRAHNQREVRQRPAPGTTSYILCWLRHVGRLPDGECDGNIFSC